MITDRIFPAVPNCGFRYVVADYSCFAGKIILTLRDEHAGLLTYINIATCLN